MRPIVAADLMTPEVLSVPETMGLAELAAFLLDNEISGAVVRDTDERPVGVVSLTDLAAVTADSAEQPSAQELSGFYRHTGSGELARGELERVESASDGLTAADIMTPQVYSVALDASVSEVARTLLDGHLHRVLVVDGDDLVGIVSASDLLGLLIEED